MKQLVSEINQLKAKDDIEPEVGYTRALHFKEIVDERRGKHVTNPYKQRRGSLFHEPWYV
jgi:hypothetical protein